MNNEFLKQKTDELVTLCRALAKKGENIVITGHDMPDSDSVISAVMLKKVLAKLFADVVIKFPTSPDSVTLRDMKKLGVWKDAYLSELENDDRLVLVDHHNSFYNNEVIACIDHHTTPPDPEGEMSLVLRASSCGKVIYDMAESCGLADDDLKKLALYSIYLDTQSCRSSKFDVGDLPWVEAAIEDCSVDKDEIERMGFCLNLPFERYEDLAMYAYKRYEYGGEISASTCIQIDANEGEWEKIISQIVGFLQKKLILEGYSLWAFVVNAPIELRSDIYFIDRNGVEIKRLDRLASRSKDVIPVVRSSKKQQTIEKQTNG